MREYIFTVRDGKTVVEEIHLFFAIPERAQDFANTLLLDRNWITRESCVVTFAPAE